MKGLLIILGACIIGLFIGLIDRNENPKKPWKPKHTPQKHVFKWKW